MKDNKELTKRDSRTQSKRSRRNSARLGPLYVDPKYIEPGYHYQFVSATIPGVLDYYTRLGFVPVKKEMQVGDQTTATSSQHGSCVTVQSKCGQELLFMRITQELWDELEEEQRQENIALQESIHNPPGIDKSSLTGSIKITGK